MDKMKYQILIYLMLLLPVQSLASIAKKMVISTNMEQSQVSITRTFSLSLNRISSIRFKSANKVELKNLTYEDSNGHIISIQLKDTIHEGLDFSKEIGTTSIKNLSFTAISLEDKKNIQIEIELMP